MGWNVRRTNLFRTFPLTPSLLALILFQYANYLPSSGVVSYYLATILETVGITFVTKQTLLNGFLNL